MNKTFLHIFSWNGTFSLFYKLVLTLHQLLLFTIVDLTTYGLINTAFATLFFLVAVSDLGTDQTLQAWYNKLISSRSWLQLSFRIISFKITICGLIAFVIYASSSYTWWLTNTLRIDIVSIIGLFSILYLIESYKKTAHTLMQLTLQTKKLVIVEVASLAIYLIFFWGWYLTNHPISLAASLRPLALASGFECIVLSYFLYIHYITLVASLPANNKYSTKPDASLSYTKIIAPAQITHYILQIMKSWHTPNALIMLSASSLGLYQTGIIKFFLTMLTLLYSFLQRAFGTSAITFLAQVEPKQQIIYFKQGLRLYYKIITAIALACLISLVYTYYWLQLPPAIIGLLLLCACIMCLEYLVIAYEQFFITQQQAGTMLMIQLTVLVLLSPGYIFGLFNLAWYVLAGLALTLLALHATVAHKI